MLKMEDDTWCRDPTELKTHITSFYQALYESSGVRNIQLVLDQCPVLVNEEMNDALTKKITMEEIRIAAFQMGATKTPLNGQFYQHNWECIRFPIARQFPLNR